jgi:hypothetical protein
MLWLQKEEQLSEKELNEKNQKGKLVFKGRIV